MLRKVEVHLSLFKELESTGVKLVDIFPVLILNTECKNTFNSINRTYLMNQGMNGERTVYCT